MAPEIIKREPHDERADIWSFGITLIELAEGRPPNNDIKSIEGLQKILERAPPSLKTPKAYSHSFVDFISKCLVKDPKERPDAIELLTVSDLLTSPICIFFSSFCYLYFSILFFACHHFDLFQTQ